MRSHSLFFTFLLCLMPLAGAAADTGPLKPLWRLAPDGEEGLRPTSHLLLAIAEGEAGGPGGSGDEGPDPRALRVRYVPWSLAAPRATSPEWNGLVRDTVYIIGMHWIVIGVLYVSPESVSRWSAADKASDYAAKWNRKVRNVVWDDDDFYVNYILHPYWGATYYVRGRERGLSRLGAFGFSFLQSAFYEFGTEAIFENPSKQDLVVTPVMGALLGAWFEQIREGIKRRRGSLSLGDKTALALTDPLGALNHQFDRLFGFDSRIRIETVAPVSGLRDPGGRVPPVAERPRHEGRSYLGLRMDLRW